MSASRLRSHRVQKTLSTTAGLLLVFNVAAAQSTWRVSKDAAGPEGIFDGTACSVSGSGRFIAFESASNNLIPNDVNNQWDIFVHDRLTGQLSFVSVDSLGVQANDGSGAASISSDGGRIAFMSGASNLVPGDNNGLTDVFVHDRLTATTTRVSVDSQGTEGIGVSYAPRISADGQHVVFVSAAANLVANDTNNAPDVFVHDIQAGSTTRVSVDSFGQEGNSVSTSPSISRDGLVIAFQSSATNLVPNDFNAWNDIFVHDRSTGQTVLVSEGFAGGQADSYSSSAEISANGKTVAFTSSATNLIPSDTGPWDDVFARDLQTGSTTRISVDSLGMQADSASGSPSISEDGMKIAFWSNASDLIDLDTNDEPDIFVHDRSTGSTKRVSMSNFGWEGNDDSSQPSISADGHYVGYRSFATNLTLGDGNGKSDIFVHGPTLTLEADPDLVTGGSNATLTTWTGAPQAPVLLAAIDLNGTPISVHVIQQSFDFTGTWTLSAPVPPSLTGAAITFISFGIAPNGLPRLSNPEVLKIQ